jgi:hypothetical protein
VRAASSRHRTTNSSSLPARTLQTLTEKVFTLAPRCPCGDRPIVARPQARPGPSSHAEADQRGTFFPRARDVRLCQIRRETPQHRR